MLTEIRVDDNKWINLCPLLTVNVILKNDCCCCVLLWCEFQNWRNTIHNKKCQNDWGGPDGFKNFIQILSTNEQRIDSGVKQATDWECYCQSICRLFLKRRIQMTYGRRRRRRRWESISYWRSSGSNLIFTVG